MEFVRIARNPWGEEVLLGLAWNVAWLVVVAGALFIVFHAFFARRSNVATASVDPGVAASIPEHVTRHGKSARYSHWVLAAATLALVITAFVPMLGLQFPWLTIHWVAGIVFGAYFVFHVVDTTVRMSWGKMMWIGPREIGEAISRSKGFFSRSENPDHRTGKWGTENKVFHHATALAGIGVLATGILMMARIDTWFWTANPYIWEISDANWGVIFLIHGATAVAFIGLLMAHFYFAARPDKWFLTRSMFRGWITKDEFLEHYDPTRWKVSKNGAPARTERREEAVGAGSASGD